jgi:NitT/TauT family transport system substrate-binding protein
VAHATIGLCLHTANERRVATCRSWLVGLVLSAIGALPSPVLAEQLTKVVLRTDYKINGYIGPFALAVERGYFRQRGLDVEIGEGQGSATTIQTVAAGGDTFGLADAATILAGVANKGIPVKIVSVYAQNDVYGLAYHPGWDGTIGSMRKKVLITSSGSSELTLLPAILASNGMTMDDIQVQFVDPHARIPLFIQTPGAFMGGYLTGDILRTQLAMPNVGVVPFAKFGANVYSTALFAKTTTLRDNPDLVSRFVAASVQGWTDAIADPEAAIQAASKMFPDSDAKLMRIGLKLMIETQMHSPSTMGKPIGWTTDADWHETTALLEKYGKLKAVDVATFYTNQFLPTQ